MQSRKRQAELQAFIDESYNERFFVLAGLVATQAAWPDFVEDWRRALLEEPSIEYFKMAEVNGRKEGQFVGWSGEQRQSKMLRLARVVNQHVLADFSVSVPVEYFNSILAPALPEKFRYPYLWLFNGLLSAIASYESNAGQHRTVDFVFDEQQQFLSKSMRLYETAKLLPPFKEHANIVGEIKKGTDSESLPLQAADLLTGQIRLFWNSPTPRMLSPPMTELKATERFSYNHMLDAPQLLAMAHNIRRWSGQW